MIIITIPNRIPNRQVADTMDDMDDKDVWEFHRMPLGWLFQLHSMITAELSRRGVLQVTVKD